MPKSITSDTSCTVRLADHLARHRVRYPRPIPTLPDLCIVDVAPAFAAPTLPLGHYYPVIIETDREWHEWDAFLRVDRETVVAPDLLDRRPSSLTVTGITFAHYDPPKPGWPWILLCCWPPAHVALVDAPADHFARGAYTIEVLPDPAARTRMQDGLFASLGRHGPVDLAVVPPSRISSRI